MSVARKLIRGLKDVSPFFVLPSQKQSNLEAPQTRPNEFISSAEIVQSPIQRKTDFSNITSCFTILPEFYSVKLLSTPSWIDALRKSYDEVYSLVSLLPGLGSSFQESKKVVRELTLTAFQIEDLLHPELAHPARGNSSLDGKRQCFFLDPKMLLKHPHLFQMLDRVILSASATEPESFVRAYQMLGACLNENPHTRFFLFIENVASDDALEIACERFAMITSRFRGCEIDFLGYSQGSEIEINQEMIREMGAFDDLLKDPLKLRLRDLFTGSLV